MSRHPGITEILAYLKPNPRLQGREAEIAEAYFALAITMVNLMDDDGPELTAALRKLLESKDCAVRHSLRDQLLAAE